MDYNLYWLICKPGYNNIGETIHSELYRFLITHYPILSLGTSLSQRRTLVVTDDKPEGHCHNKAAILNNADNQQNKMVD